MSTIDRAALIEQAARAQWASCWPGLPWPAGDAITVETWSHDTAAALPVIAKALLAPLRELHSPIDAVMFSGRTETLTKVCSACGTDDGNWQRHPCPTVRLLDAIEAEVQP